MEELILAMADNFKHLKKRGHGERTMWLAQARPHPIVDKDIRYTAKTPLEALQGLYNKLNEKSVDKL
jgi:hypothetical protein